MGDRASLTQSLKQGINQRSPLTLESMSIFQPVNSLVVIQYLKLILLSKIVLFLNLVKRPTKFF